MDPIRQLWTQAKFRTQFVPPKVLYAFNKNGEKFIVIEDNRTIFRVMNNQGQVYLIANIRCKLHESGTYYICDEPFHIISCKKHETDIDQYASDVIRAAVFVNK